MPRAGARKFQAPALAAIVVGLVALLLTWFLPTRWLQPGWTAQEAAKRREFSDLHHEPKGRLTLEERKKLEEAHRVLSDRLEKVIQGPELWQQRLKWGGITLICAGAVGYAIARQSDQ